MNPDDTLGAFLGWLAIAAVCAVWVALAYAWRWVRTRNDRTLHAHVTAALRGNVTRLDERRAK